MTLMSPGGAASGSAEERGPLLNQRAIRPDLVVGSTTTDGGSSFPNGS